MKVDGENKPMLSWEEEYCRYFDIDIIAYCDVNLRYQNAILTKLRWINEDNNPLTGPGKETIVSRYWSGKVLLAITENYKFNEQHPNYLYYTAYMEIVIDRDKNINKLIIDKITIDTFNCVHPEYTMKLHLSGYNILPDTLLEKDSKEEISSELSYEFVEPNYVTPVVYRYDEDYNEFLRFDSKYNTKEFTGLIVDIDPLTLELLQKVNSKGKKLLNIRLSNMVSKIVEEINSLTYIEEDKEEEETN